MRINAGLLELETLNGGDDDLVRRCGVGMSAFRTKYGSSVHCFRVSIRFGTTSLQPGCRLPDCRVGLK
jgi:hypothetical protein